MDAYKRKMLEDYLDWDMVDTSLLVEATEENASENNNVIGSGTLYRDGKYYIKVLKNENDVEKLYQAMTDRAPAKIYDEITKISADVHKIKGWVVHFAVNAIIAALLVLFNIL